MITISGSLAHDTIMNFPDSFKNHILPDKIHQLNLSFLVEKFTKNFGGCAGNIAYNLALLNENSAVVGILGTDGDKYLAHLKDLKIDTDLILTKPDSATAAATIITDQDDNQISAFYPGAVVPPSDLPLFVAEKKPNLVLLSPTAIAATVNHALLCERENIPFVFDPGQQTPAFSPPELLSLIKRAAFLIGNDYEIEMISRRLDLTLEELLQNVPTVIITRGAAGSIIRTKNEIIEISAARVESVEDPTGAGDAYRAGFFTGFLRGQELLICGQMGSVAAAYAVEHHGTQNHKFTENEFINRLNQNYS